MQEVREICEEMLAEPAPPMTAPDDVLGFARRSRARHRARLGIGFAAAATLVAIAAVPLLTRPPQGQPSTVAAAPTSAAPETVPVAALLPEGAVLASGDEHSVWVLRALADSPEPTGDLCQAELPNRFRVQVDTGSCEVITIGAVKIRTGTYQTKGSRLNPGTTTAEVTFAIRYKDGKAYLAFQVPKPGQPGLSRRELAEALLTSG